MKQQAPQSHAIIYPIVTFIRERIAKIQDKDATAFIEEVWATVISSCFLLAACQKSLAARPFIKFLIHALCRFLISRYPLFETLPHKASERSLAL